MGHPAPLVESVNGQEGEVELTAADVGAIPASTVTAAGDLIVGTGAGAVTRLAQGANGAVLHAKADGSGPGYSSRLIDDGSAISVVGDVGNGMRFSVRDSSGNTYIRVDRNSNGSHLIVDGIVYVVRPGTASSITLSAVGQSIGLGSGTTLEWWGNPTVGFGAVDLRVRRSQDGLLAVDNGTAGQYRDLICRNVTLSGGVLHLGRFTVATLPTAGVVAGATAFVDDGCKVAETPGTESGTGVPVYYSGSDWLTYQDIEVQA